MKGQGRSGVELTLDGFLGKFRLTGFDFLQCLADFGACLRGGDNVEPVLLRALGVRCHDFHLVAAVQLLAQLDILAVHLGTDALASKLGVDAECKVEYGRAFRKFEQIAFRCEDKDFVFVKFQLPQGRVLAGKEQVSLGGKG